MKKTIMPHTFCLAVFAMILFFASAEISAFQTIVAKNSYSKKNKNIEKINTVRAIVFSWAETWKNKDVNNYMSYYSPKFQSGEIDYQLWREKKAKLFQRPGIISLEISDLWVFVEGNHATASFVQKYRDAKHSDIGEKVLNLIYVNGTWQIISEEWKPLRR